MTKITPYLERIDKNPNILNLHINLLNKCNCKCIMCRKYEWPNESLDFNKMKKFINEFILQGGETIFFSGGEPLLYNELELLIEYLNKTNLRYSFITTTLRSKDRMELIAKNAYRIHVSFDAVDKDIFKSIRGVDAANETYDNIKFMQSFRKDKIPVRLSMTINNLNYKQILATYAIAEELNCMIHYTLVNLWDGIKPNKEQLESIYNDLSKLNIEVATNISLKKEIDEIYTYGEIRKPEKCIIQKIHMLLDPDGSIYPCCVLLEENDNYNYKNKTIYGNIYKDNIRDIFKKAQELTYNPLQKCCDSCINRYIHINKEYSNYIKQNNKLFI